MSNKGFTLVEMMAVIAIIAILGIVITPGIISIRNSVLESTLASRVSMIENAAKDYAQEHIDELKSQVSSTYDGSKSPNQDCIYRNVNFLINAGYLKSTNSYTGLDGEKENQIINPVTGESMNNQRVCIRFNTNNAMTREVIAYVVEEN